MAARPRPPRAPPAPPVREGTGRLFRHEPTPRSAPCACSAKAARTPAAATGCAPTRCTCASTRNASSSPTPALSISKQTKPRASSAALNAEFADIGQFHVASARRWYLRLNVPVNHPVEPISAVAGRRVAGEINGSALPLTRWLNEVQMFLHGHPLNEQREQIGQPAINSLWLWGGGSLPTAMAANFSAVFSNDPLAAGLARAAGLPLHARPGSLAALLPLAGERPLVLLDQLLPYVVSEDGEGWRSALEQLEADWFAPLKKALGKQVDRISLIAPTVYGELRYTLTAGDRWKLWKSGKPIAETAKELAQ